MSDIDCQCQTCGTWWPLASLAADHCSPQRIARRAALATLAQDIDPDVPDRIMRTR